MTTEPLQKRAYSIFLYVTCTLFLYTYQGFFFGYMASIKLMLKKNHVSYEKLALFDFISAPLYLKCFVSPFLDIHYTKLIGKRMTYIFPISIVLSAIYFVLSSRITELVENAQIESLTFIFFIMMLLICVQDVAIDSLCEEIFNESDQKYGSMMQTMGQIVGPLISFNIYVYLIDKIDNVAEYFALIMCVFCIVTTIISYVIIKEDNNKSEFDSAFFIFKRLPQFFKNKNLRSYIFFLILYPIGSAFWQNTQMLVLIDKGFEKDWISELNTLSLIFGFLMIIVITKIKLVKKTIYKLFTYVYAIEIMIHIIQFLNVVYFDITKDETVTYYMCCITTILSVVGYLRFTALCVNTNLICDPNLSGTFISVLNSVSNFSRLCWNPLFTYLLKYDYKIMVPFFLSYSVFFAVFMNPYFMNKFNKLERKDFMISENNKFKSE